MSDDERQLDPVTALRRMYPGWQIEVEGDHWVAVNRPAQNAQHILVAHTIRELAGKLEAERDR